MGEQLKPCPVPWCDNPRPKVHEAYGLYRVRCNECQTQTPLDHTEAGAVEAWNTRPSAPASPSREALEAYERGKRDAAEVALAHRAPSGVPQVDYDQACTDVANAILALLPANVADAPEGASLHDMQISPEGWPSEATFAENDSVTTRRVPIFRGRIAGWYRNQAMGGFGYAVENFDVPGLIHVYPERALDPLVVAAPSNPPTTQRGEVPVAEIVQAALEAWKALPDDERNGERPFIHGFNMGWEEALAALPQRGGDITRAAKAMVAALCLDWDQLGDGDQAYWKGLAEVAIKDMLAFAREPAPASAVVMAMRDLTDVADRLCTAIDRQEQDIGGESVKTVLQLLGPACDRGIAVLKALPDHVALEPGFITIRRDVVEPFAKAIARFDDIPDIIVPIPDDQVISVLALSTREYPLTYGHFRRLRAALSTKGGEQTDG